jgi:hypothetical protein
VSILNRVIPNRHLDDAALAEIWAASAASGDPASNPHFDSCPECRLRYDELVMWLERLRTEAVSDADAAFPADRLAAQQAQILRRIEAVGRPARVIAFPRFTRPLSARPSVAHRWVTAAAAAGLVIGVALGQWLDLSHRFGSQPGREGEVALSAPAPVPQPEIAIQTARTGIISDEALLSELDASLAMHPAVEPLRAIDTITPRSRDFFDQSR